MLPYGVGVKPDTPWIRDVIRHEQTGLLVDPRRGAIYGAAGTPIGAVCGDGYVRVGGGRNGYLYAHRIVYEAARCAIPAGLEINHRNGKKADNRACNLEAVTRLQNVRHAMASGLTPVGERKPEAKLTVETVKELRRTVGLVTHAEWARRLGVDKTTIRHARTGKTWRHVKCRARALPSPSPHSRQRSRRRLAKG